MNNKELYKELIKKYDEDIYYLDRLFSSKRCPCCTHYVAFSCEECPSKDGEYKCFQQEWMKNAGILKEKLASILRDRQEFWKNKLAEVKSNEN